MHTYPSTHLHPSTPQMEISHIYHEKGDYSPKDYGSGRRTVHAGCLLHYANLFYLDWNTVQQSGTLTK